MCNLCQLMEAQAQVATGPDQHWHKVAVRTAMMGSISQLVGCSAKEV